MDKQIVGEADILKFADLIIKEYIKQDDFMQADSSKNGRGPKEALWAAWAAVAIEKHFGVGDE